MEKINWRVVFSLVVLAVVGVAASGLIGTALGTIPERRFLPEIALTILLLASLVALLAALWTGVAIFGALNLANRDHSLGLPPGSVRAVIALSLILIFAITSVFLFRQLQAPPTSKLSGITQEQLADIPGEEIISSEPSEAGENLFDVERRLRNDAAVDFAKQMLTTISTLVVAVSGFYFGTKAVETGSRTAIGAARVREELEIERLRAEREPVAPQPPGPEPEPPEPEPQPPEPEPEPPEPEPEPPEPEPAPLEH